MDPFMLRALQEVEIAKQIIENGDYAEARRKLVEVKQHVPNYTNISAMLAVCDILNSADFRFLGIGVDHYWVLQVSPDASESQIKRQFNKFIRLLQPIRANNFPGASSALQMVENAFTVLSNQDNRLAFDSKRDARLKSYGFDLSGGDVATSVANFDMRTECLKQKWSMKDFATDQVWAIYDNGLDLMPRRYVVVNRVASSSKVCVTLMEPYPIHDEEVSWFDENLPFSCGLFRTGKGTVELEFSRFSHVVACERTDDDDDDDECLYKIYPKIGEVWAMYGNWNSRCKYADDFGRHEYRIVEIVRDFSEEQGLVVACLREVSGYITLFHRQIRDDGDDVIPAIPRMKMLSFSHQIPAFTVVAGGAIHGIPENSWHLDPDALPLKSS